MLRLIHAQTVTGAIYIDDVDDGLPNKQTKRLGSTANPDIYKRDGYAHVPKQPCYIPRTDPVNASQPGYIDLEETERVQLSAFGGKIKGFQDSGLISVVSLTAADLAAPVATLATLADPAAGDVTIDGTGFLSVAPVVTSVTLAGAGVGLVALTEAQIEAVAPGAVSATEIIIDSTLAPSLATGDTVTVTADGQTSDPVYVTVDPAITSATLGAPAAGDITIVGTDFLSFGAAVTSVNLAGAGVGDITLTATQIAAVAPGAVTATSVIIDSTLVPSLAAGDVVTVTANGRASAGEVVA